MSASSHRHAPELRPVIPAVRWLLLAFVVLTATAAVNLYLLSAHTERWFAWTVQPPLTAAFMGAGYAAGCTISMLALRERSWARVRLPFVVVWIFATLTLGATLLHVDRFHFAAPGAVARIAAVVWLAVYVVVPVAMAVLLPLQARARGDDPAPGPDMAGWLRVALSLQGAVLLVAGAALFVIPETAAPAWPWELSPLTARSVAAWLVALGAAAVMAVRDNDLAPLAAPLASYAVLGALQIGALVRFGEHLRTDSPSAWIYTAVMISVLLTGVYGTVVARRAERQTAQPPTAGADLR